MAYVPLPLTTNVSGVSTPMRVPKVRTKPLPVGWWVSAHVPSIEIAGGGDESLPPPQAASRAETRTSAARTPMGLHSEAHRRLHAIDYAGNRLAARSGVLTSAAT